MEQRNLDSPHFGSSLGGLNIRTSAPTPSKTNGNCKHTKETCPESGMPSFNKYFHSQSSDVACAKKVLLP